MRLSINEMTTYRWSFEEDVSHFRRAQVPAIGVWRRKIADFGESRGIELIKESGLAVSNLLWAGGFTGNDGRTFRESIDDALEAIRLAADLKAGCLVLYSGARAGHTHNHARRLLRDALSQLVDAAERANVVLALEPMHAAFAGEWTFLNTLDETLAMLEPFPPERVKLVFDTYHLGWDRGNLERIEALVPRIAVVHLGDGKSPPETEQNRAPLGSGELPLREILAALAGGGYHGYCDVELLGEEIELADYGELLQRSVDQFARLTAGLP